MSSEIKLHALGAWALAEAATALPDEAWVTQAAELAARYLEAVAIDDGWPKRAGLAADAETTRWCRLVSNWIRPGRTGEGERSPRDLSLSGGSLRESLEANWTGAAGGPASVTDPFGRLVGASSRGGLKLVG